MTATNDLAQRVAEVAEGIRACIELIEKHYPNAKMLDRSPVLQALRQWEARLDRAVKASTSPPPASAPVAWITPGGDVSRSFSWCLERCLPGQQPRPLYAAQQQGGGEINMDVTVRDGAWVGTYTEWCRRKRNAPPSAPVGVEAIREAFDEISGLCRHLRQGGPVPEDLQDLSDALDEAVGIAANMLHALAQQPAAEHEPCAAVAAIQFALTDPEGMTFLRLWNEGEFDTLRREWPDAMRKVYDGADPLAQQPAAGAVDKVRFRKAPCYLCGYNGPGYYQPDTHPCAAKYHATQHQEPNDVDRR